MSDGLTEIAFASCRGDRDCEAEVHIHGCFADEGACDHPEEHELDFEEFEGGYPWPNL